MSPGLLLLDGGLATLSGGLFVDTAGTDCCCEPKPPGGCPIGTCLGGICPNTVTITLNGTITRNVNPCAGLTLVNPSLMAGQLFDPNFCHWFTTQGLNGPCTSCGATSGRFQWGSAVQFQDIDITCSADQWFIDHFSVSFSIFASGSCVTLILPAVFVTMQASKPSSQCPMGVYTIQNLQVDPTLTANLTGITVS